MIRVNGTGEGMSGRVHPDNDVDDLYCDRCEKETSFIKMLGVRRNYIFWIPLPTQEEDGVYWKCTRCNSFIIFGSVGMGNYYSTAGSSSGVFKDETVKEKSKRAQKTLL